MPPATPVVRSVSGRRTERRTERLYREAAFALRVSSSADWISVRVLRFSALRPEELEAIIVVEGGRVPRSDGILTD
jgi:hypothetical protein